MDVHIAEQKAYIFNDVLTAQTARERALEKKGDAFGTMAKFLQRPKTEEIQIVYSEKRYEPFWYVDACATYIYDRTQKYRVALPDAAVKEVTINGQAYTPQKEKDSQFLALTGTEHCEDTSGKQVYLDGASGAKSDFSAYLKFPAAEVPDQIGRAHV